MCTVLPNNPLGNRVPLLIFRVVHALGSLPPTPVRQRTNGFGPRKQRQLQTRKKQASRVPRGNLPPTRLKHWPVHLKRRLLKHPELTPNKTLTCLLPGANLRVRPNRLLVPLTPPPSLLLSTLPSFVTTAKNRLVQTCALVLPLPRPSIRLRHTHFLLGRFRVIR